MVFASIKEQEYTPQHKFYLRIVELVIDKIRNDPSIDMDEASLHRLAAIWSKKIEMSHTVRKRMPMITEQNLLKNEDIASHHIPNMTNRNIRSFPCEHRIPTNVVANNSGGEKRVLSIPATTATLVLHSLIKNQNSLPVTSDFIDTSLTTRNFDTNAINIQKQSLPTVSVITDPLSNIKSASTITKSNGDVDDNDNNDEFGEYQLDGNNDFYNFNGEKYSSNEEEEEDDDDDVSVSEEDEYDDDNNNDDYNELNLKPNNDEINVISDDEVDDQIKSLTSKDGIFGLNGINIDDITKTTTEDNDDLVEEEPLNSGDDISDDNNHVETAENDNIIICQYDKISKTKSKWKVELKSGIATLNGIDIVFRKALGEFEW